MSGHDAAGGQLLVDAIDFQIPCRRFTIKANVTRDRQMPVVDEFVLRLLRVVQRISGQRLAGYFGFTAREMESVLLELVERGLDRKSTRLNSSHYCASRMPSSA